MQRGKSTYQNKTRTGGEFDEKEINEGKGPSLVIIIVGVILVILLIATLALTSVFSGIAAFRTFPTVNCSDTAPISGDNEINIDILNTLNDVINTLTETRTCKSICANGCLKKFYTCASDENPEDCERRSLILKDCDNFVNCLGECSLAFDHCVVSMEGVSEFSGGCVNKYNREIICPKT